MAVGKKENTIVLAVYPPFDRPGQWEEYTLLAAFVNLAGLAKPRGICYTFSAVDIY